MGVSGCGKSTVGRLLADRLGVPFHDADDFHPAANREKMAAGSKLDLLAAEAKVWVEDGDGAVLACSALRRVYRQRLKTRTDRVRFVFLSGGKDVIRQRMQQRQGHYMPPALLDSQFETLEEPGRVEDPDDPAIHVGIDQDAEMMVGEILAALSCGGEL
jgi:gluconokinase